MKRYMEKKDIFSSKILNYTTKSHCCDIDIRHGKQMNGTKYAFQKQILIMYENI